MNTPVTDTTTIVPGYGFPYPFGRRVALSTGHEFEEWRSPKGHVVILDFEGLALKVTLECSALFIDAGPVTILFESPKAPVVDAIDLSGLPVTDVNPNSGRRFGLVCVAPKGPIVGDVVRMATSQVAAYLGSRPTFTMTE